MKSITPTSHSWYFSLIILAFCAGCSSSGLKFKERRVKTSETSYTVVNASSDTRPSWINAPQAASRKLADSNEKNLYFSFESGPKISREIACNIVRVYARDDLAKKIVDFYLDDRDVEGEIDLNWRLVMASEGSRVLKMRLNPQGFLQPIGSSDYTLQKLVTPKRLRALAVVSGLKFLRSSLKKL